jgi:5-(carboxyamino)imidazole ribonucleotide mutase
MMQQKEKNLQLFEVSIVMGSISDWDAMKPGCETLNQYNINYDINVLSAHRNPIATHEYAVNADKRGVKVIIAGAGGAAHLPGVIAASTVLPVIGVPIKTSLAGGLDSMLSIVQMPKGVSVATVGVNNSTNAALLALQMLALSDEDLKEKIIIEREKKEQESQMFTHEWFGNNLEKREKSASSFNKVFEPYSLGG